MDICATKPLACLDAISHLGIPPSSTPPPPPPLTGCLTPPRRRCSGRATPSPPSPCPARCSCCSAARPQRSPAHLRTAAQTCAGPMRITAVAGIGTPFPHSMGEPPLSPPAWPSLWAATPWRRLPDPHLNLGPRALAHQGTRGAVVYMQPGNNTMQPQAI